MTLFADVVCASRQVAATSSRSRKVATLAELLSRLGAGEVPICVGFLSGMPRQGRVGVGYSTIYGIELAPAAKASLAVSDVDRAIDEIEQATGSGSAATRQRILMELLGRATEDEADFLRALLTGQLRQGALAGLMADAVAKAAGVSGEIARRALMLSGDLTRMAEIAMSSGEAGLRGVGFEMFRPILPMLASTATTVTEAVAGFERASVEWKLDGIRIQIHRRGAEVRIYTRNLNEITGSLPGIVSVVLGLPVAQVVLDGEALWMGDDGPAAFQQTVSQIDSDAPPEGVVTFLFDLLHVDGEDLLDTPLQERAARLEAIAPQLKIAGVLTTFVDQEIESQPALWRRASTKVLAITADGKIPLAHGAAQTLAMEYRHGPISTARPGTVVWSLDHMPPGLADEITETGAHLVTASADPLVELVRAQRLAVAMARSRGLDPDRPRNLTRSVVLEGDRAGLSA
jgi:DNA ligase 1